MSQVVNATGDAVALVPADLIKIGNLDDYYQTSTRGGIYYHHGDNWWNNGYCTYTAFGKGERNFITDLKETLGGIVERMDRMEEAQKSAHLELKETLLSLTKSHADTKAELMAKIQALTLKIDEDIARVELKITALQSTIGALSAARSISPAPQRAVAHAAGVLPPAVPVRTASPLKR